MVSRKKQETEELLRREISSIILRELKDPRLGFVTLTRVLLGGDYKTAKVFVMTKGTEAERENTLLALSHARGKVQALVAERIKMRNTPVMTFLEDEEVRRALRVDRLIDEVKQDEDQVDE